MTTREQALAAADLAIRPLLDSVDMDDLVTHNAGYAGYAEAPFDRFVGDERGRFAKAIDLLNLDRPSRVVDLGCFIPHLPIALARLGHRVTIVERFELYGPSFGRELTRVASEEGIEVVDTDLSSDDLVRLGAFDVVLLMAVLEHLNGSPRALLERIRSILAPGGRLLVEVPNIAELGQRLRLALGRSPLPDYGTYLASAYPFTGHNREMTAAELRFALEATGYRVEHLEDYDYVPWTRLSRNGRLLRRAKRVLTGSFGESVVAVAT